MPPAEKLAAPADPIATMRWFLYGLVIAVAAGQSLGALLTADRYFTPSAPDKSPQGFPKRKPPATPMFSANDRSRWATVYSLVHGDDDHYHTYKIDQIIKVPGWNTIDKVSLPDQDDVPHFYSSKPPLLSNIVAGIYWGLNRAYGYNLIDQHYETIYMILLIVNWVPYIFCLGLLAVIVERYAQSDLSRILVVVAAAFGTFWSPFLVTLNNHTVAICSVICTLYPLLRILKDGERSWWLFAACGFFGAFTACNELPAASLGVVLFVLLVVKAPKQTLLIFVPAAMIPVAAFEYTNFLAVGRWEPAYSLFGTSAYLYPGSYWKDPKGIDKGGDSWPMYLLHCTFGHHGIFSLTPLWLLLIAAWLRATFLPKKTAEAPLTLMTWLSLILTAVVLGFYLKQTKSYNYGGVTSGLRWTFWLIPFWLLGLVPLVDAWGSKRLFRVVTVVLLGISAFSVRWPHMNPWQHPWLYKLMEANGWISYQ